MTPGGAAHPPAEAPTIPLLTRGDQRACRRDGRSGYRQPTLLALTLCLFLFVLVGVPILVLTIMLTAHAEDWSAPPNDGLASQAGGDPGDDGPLVGQPDSQDRSTPTPAPVAPDLTHAAAAQQVLTATQPQPAGQQPAQADAAGSLLVARVGATAPEPGPDSQDAGGPLPITPNLLFPLDLNTTQDRQRTTTATGDSGGGGSPASGDQPAAGTWRLRLVLVRGQSGPPDPPRARTHPDPPATPTAHEPAGQPQPTGHPDPDPDPASLVMAPGDPTPVQTADLQIPTDLRIQPDTAAFSPSSQPQLIQLGRPDLLRAGISGPSFAYGAPAASSDEPVEQPDWTTP